MGSSSAAAIEPRAASLVATGVARGLAIFLGGFVALNLACGELFDASDWIVAATRGAFGLGLVLASLLFAWGVAPGFFRGAKRFLVIAAAIGFSLACSLDSLAAMSAFESGRATPWLPLPLSTFFALAGVAIAFVSNRRTPD